MNEKICVQHILVIHKMKVSFIMQVKKSIYHIIIFPIVLVYFEVLLRAFAKTGIFSDLLYPVLFGVGAGLFFSCITSVFSEKVNWIISIVLLFIAGVIFIVECLVYRSFHCYMPLGGIGSVASDVVSGYTETVFTTIITGIPVILAFLLPTILYAIWGRKLVPSERQTVKLSVIVLIGAVISTGAGVLLASFGSDAAKYKSQYKFDTATQHFGLVSSLQLSTVYSLFGNASADTLIITTGDMDSEIPLDDTASESSGVDESGSVDTENPADTDSSGDGSAVGNTEESVEVVEKVYEKNEMNLPLDEISASTSDETLISMNEYVKSISSSSQNEYTGLFEGKNLILICAEAFSHAAVDPELTPTLYRLTHNGFYFSDYYQPYWGGSTSTGEYSMLMGIAPLRGIETLPQTENKNLYFTMGNQLQRLGYSGNAYHNGSYTYYSRNLTHQNLGYDEYIALGSGLEELSRWWPTDVEMTDATLPTYIDNQPFSVYYMTGSGHFPYNHENLLTTWNIEYVDSIVGDRYKDTTLAYLCYQMELEYALASMVEQLEAAKIADDTVICITSDHYPYGLKKSSTYGNSEDYLSDLYGYYPENNWERDKNAWILWSGCLENEYKDMACEISEPTYSLDILPTLSNLFGLEYDSRLLVGRDVFSDTEPLVLWTDYSWVTKEGKYDAETDIFYPNEGSAVGDEYVEQMKIIVSNKLSFSDKIHSYDYYDILFGEESESTK